MSVVLLSQSRNCNVASVSVAYPIAFYGALQMCS